MLFFTEAILLCAVTNPTVYFAFMPYLIFDRLLMTLLGEI